MLQVVVVGRDSVRQLTCRSAHSCPPAVVLTRAHLDAVRHAAHEVICKNRLKHKQTNYMLDVTFIIHPHWLIVEKVKNQLKVLVFYLFIYSHLSIQVLMYFLLPYIRFALVVSELFGFWIYTSLMSSSLMGCMSHHCMMSCTLIQKTTYVDSDDQWL